MATDDETEPFCEEGDLISDGTVKRNKKKRWSYACLSRTLTLPFCFFVINAFASLLCGVFFIVESDFAYMISGPLGITICAYGLKHFRTLIDLKTEIDDFAKSNIKMNKEVGALKREVNRMSLACADLKGTQIRINQANEQNRENLTRFRMLQNQIDQLNLETAAQLQGAMVKAVVVHGKWEEEMYKHQRELLHNVFERFEKASGNRNSIGMSETQYRLFLDELPETYKGRFAKMGGFEMLSGGKNHILFADFSLALDIFAEMEATDCDIEFEFREASESPEAEIPGIALLNALGPIEERPDSSKYDEMNPSIPILHDIKEEQSSDFGNLQLNELTLDLSQNTKSNQSPKISRPGTLSRESTKRQLVITRRTYKSNLSMASVYGDNSMSPRARRNSGTSPGSNGSATGILNPFMLSPVLRPTDISFPAASPEWDEPNLSLKSSFDGFELKRMTMRAQQTYALNNKAIRDESHMNMDPVQMQQSFDRRTSQQIAFLSLSNTKGSDSMSDADITKFMAQLAQQEMTNTEQFAE